MGRRTWVDQYTDAKEDEEEYRQEQPEVSVLKKRPPEKKEDESARSRKWEEEQREAGKIVLCFRNCPPSLRSEIKQLANEHGVRMGELGRLFLEYALDAYREGELGIEPVVNDGQLTLFPGEDY